MSEPARWSQTELDEHMRKLKGVSPAPAKQGRSVVPRGRRMNKVEAAYDAFLAQCEVEGAIKKHRYESITLLLADGCRYTPDFAITIHANFGFENYYLRTELHEVKGTRKRKSGIVGPHIEDDARVKLLTAAKLYPEFRFKLCWLDQGRWQIEDIAQ